MHVPAGRRMVWSQVFHISEESPNCWIPKQKYNIAKLCQLHKMCSGAAGMCLNIRHCNTHLFGDSALDSHGN